MKLLTRALMALAFLLVVAGPAQAGRYFLQVHGGYAFFLFDDVNDAIDRVNDSAGDQVMGHIYSGLDAGLQAGFALTRELDLGLGFSRQWASSGYSRAGHLVEYDLPANLYEIFLDYLPATEKSVRYGAGTTLGMISSAASVLVIEPNVPDRNLAFDGIGFHFAAYAIVDAALSPSWSMFGKMGFRHALLNHLTVDGQTVYNPDSVDDKLRFNYSGVFFRVGVKFQP